MDDFTFTDRHGVCMVGFLVFQHALCQFLGIALEDFRPVLDIVIDIDGDVEIALVSVVEEVLGQKLQGFQDLAMIADDPARLIGVYLDVDGATVVRSFNAGFHIHIVQDFLHIVRYCCNHLVNIVAWFHLDVQV